MATGYQRTQLLKIKDFDAWWNLKKVIITLDISPDSLANSKFLESKTVNPMMDEPVCRRSSISTVVKSFEDINECYYLFEFASQIERQKNKHMTYQTCC